MINVRNIHKSLMEKDSEYRKEYTDLEEEFAWIDALIKARVNAGINQAELAKRLGVSQPAVAKIEFGNNVGIKTLKRYAKAMGYSLTFDLQVIPQARNA
ncbi:MAG: helix-turn-helix transcriptional regulator [Desulfatirhabdiaceae bacterium]